MGKFIQVFILSLLSLSILHCHCQEQVRIQLTGKPFEYSISWQSLQKEGVSNVRFGYSAAVLDQVIQGTTNSFSACYVYSSVTRETVIKVEPQKSIFYQVSNDGRTWSKTFEFKTPPSWNNHDFSFIAYGDTDITPETRGIVSAVQREQNYELILHAGDYAYDWPWSQSRWDDWGKLFEPLTSTRPYISVVGNHEWNCLFQFENYKNRFSKLAGVHSGGDGNLYYGLLYNWVHFIALSSEHPIDEKSKQYAWLEGELKKVNRTQTPWLIVSWHEPLYTSLLDRYPGNQLIRNSLEPLLLRYGVDLVIAAHDHHYERICNIYENSCGRGPSHLILGTAGRYLYTGFKEPKDVWSMFRESTHGYAKFHVTKSSLSLLFTRLNGTVADRHVWNK
jgi:hypothetical protein